MSRKATAVNEPPTRERAPDEFRAIAVTDVQGNTWNPRRSLDAVRQGELEQSIREVGIIEPLIVRPWNGGYEVVAGMRRYTAATTIGLALLPCVIKDLTSTEALEFALTENLQRLDMHPLDEAEAFKTLQASEPRVYTVAKIAARVGQTESHVYRRLRLLDLEPDLRTALAEDRLSLGHAERLLRLDPKRRKEAADPTHGVVWRRSPLLEYNAKWTPAREDLRPLNELEKFIRDKTHFDPLSADTRHFQPDLAEQLAPAPLAWEDDGVEGEVPNLIELSEDPMARMRMGAKPGDPIPLTPSKWREIKTEKQRCEFTVRGVVTHGGPARVLDVCTKKSCQKHFPVAKKTQSASTSGKPAKPQARPSWEIENEKRELAQKAWEGLRPHACAALVAHLKAAKLKFSADIVRVAIDGHSIRSIEKTYGVKLIDETAVLILALGSVETYNRERFLEDVKVWKFNLGSVEQKVKAAEEKAATDVKAKPAKKGKAA